LRRRPPACRWRAARAWRPSAAARPRSRAAAARDRPASAPAYRTSRHPARSFMIRSYNKGEKTVRQGGGAARRLNMLAPKAEVGSWMSEAARVKFMAAYERAFALWPQPAEEFDVETATATTRVHAYRPRAGGEPVVLLTGAGFNAAGW